MKFLVTVSVFLLLSLIAEHTVTRVGAQDDTQMEQDTGTANDTKPTDQAEQGGDGDLIVPSGATNQTDNGSKAGTPAAGDVTPANNTATDAPTNDTATDAPLAPENGTATDAPLAPENGTVTDAPLAPGNGTATDAPLAPENGTATDAPVAPGNGTHDATGTTKADNSSMSTTQASSALEGTDCNTHFHTASFIGGIVLCGGLVAIIFFAVHIYRKQSENRYHQF